MKKMLVAGAGLVASPLVNYLLDQPDFEVVVGDIDVGRARKVVGSRPRGRAKELFVENSDQLRAEIARADLVVSMVPYTFHPIIAAAAVELGKSVVTASYVSPAMKALDARAKEKGVLILNELGLDPGIDHMEAMRIIHKIRSEGGRVASFTSYCGGLPAADSNTNPFGYKFSWSPRGVLLASKNSARFLRDGVIITILPERLFENPEMITIPGLGEFEGYPNRDSVSYRDIYGIPEAQNVLRGTLRYPGWCRTLKKIGDLGLLDETEREWTARTYLELMAELVQAAAGADIRNAVALRLGIDRGSDIMERLEWLGLFESEPLPFIKGSALDILMGLMIDRLRYEPGERDMIVLQHVFDVEGWSGRKERITSTLIDYGIPNGDSSMSRTVGLPAGIAARLIVEGRIPMTGVRIPVYPEVYNPILDELAALGIRFEEKREDV